MPEEKKFKTIDEKPSRKGCFAEAAIFMTKKRKTRRGSRENRLYPGGSLCGHACSWCINSHRK